MVVFDRDVGIVVWGDGVSRTTLGTFTRSISNTGAFNLGRSPEESFPQFQGWLDEVAVYPAALSAARVAAHRSAGRGTG